MKPSLSLLALLVLPILAQGPRACAANSATVLSPSPYSVFQRSARNTTAIPVEGTCPPGTARVEARVALMAPYAEGVDGTSSAFVEIANPAGREFRGILRAAAGGWYRLEIRTLDAKGAPTGEAAVERIGVGEVFVAAGHSFCSNFQGDKPGRAEEDRVSTCVDWSDKPPQPLRFRHADDPMRPGDANRASPWPSVGDNLVRALHVPVMIICTGIGGTTVHRWREGVENPETKDIAYIGCRETLKSITPYTGVRAIIWFGNENDLSKGPTAEEFADNFRRLIAGTRKDAGIPDLPWVIGFDAFDPGVSEKVGLEEKTRRKERIDRGTEMVLQTVPFTYDGPQTDDLGLEFRRVDEDHFNEVGVRELGVRFTRKILQAFQPRPVPEPTQARVSTPRAR